MIQPGEIQSIAGKEGVRDTQIEKNYIISWVTYGIANNPLLKKNLIFKGGTVLKKVYFAGYRFSEDLDFSFNGKDFEIDTIKAAFTELIGWVYEESRITLSVKDETQHETGNFNFYLSYTGPLGGVGANKDIKVDISQDELLYNAPEKKRIINSYSDLEQEEYSISCYTLGEVIAEKMRSLMQRTAPRDIYDLWYLFEIEGQNIEDHIFAFQDKAKHKGYDPKELTKVVEQKEKTSPTAQKRQMSLDDKNSTKNVGYSCSTCYKFKRAESVNMKRITRNIQWCWLMHKWVKMLASFLAVTIGIHAEKPQCRFRTW